MGRRFSLGRRFFRNLRLGHIILKVIFKVEIRKRYNNLSRKIDY
jgi:hypothetical protein